jgi:hypothetical protein
MIRCLLVLVVAATLSGCSAYTYNDARYGSQQAAFAAQAVDMEAAVQGIEIQPRTIDGTALVLIPSRRTIEATSLTKTGTPAKALITYIVSLLAADYGNMSRCLAASRAFSNVESRVVDFPVREARDSADEYAATIYLQTLTPTQGGWLLLRPGLEIPAQVHMDTIAAPGAPRINSWIADIVKKYHAGAKQ